MTLKRSPMKPGAGFKARTVAMKGSAFARVEKKEAASSDKAARGMKRKRPKMTPIRASARGEACTLRFPCCSFDQATTVWCHSNRAEDGKGMGIKARDEEGCYGCAACHAWLDGGYAGRMERSLVDVYFDLARASSQKILQHKGLMKCGPRLGATSAGPVKTITEKILSKNMIPEHESALATEGGQP
jgi:hypothetical protein